MRNEAYRRQAVENSGDRQIGWQPYQPHPGTRCHRCGCSLPGLTGFTADHCEGTGRATITNPPLRRAAPLYRLIHNLQGGRRN